jgi:hypothetical protein
VLRRLIEEVYAGLSEGERRQLDELLRRIGRNVGVEV